MTTDRERLLQRILVVFLVVGLIVLLVVGRAAHRADAAKRAEAEATKTARQSIPTILSYTDSSLANQLASSRRLMTPRYAARYESMVRSRVWPQARRFGVANQLRVVSLGTVKTTEHAAVILVFANLTTRTKAKPLGLTQGTRLEVTLRHRDGQWLVDDLRPL